ncbi:chemotaxis protein CheD [Pseudaquabacterium rugosum]|uniref:Probable chemoreceptor glutamine deamidase CheD n=1 Tax=Pseudaquabacterium rugosum TaxID=2984194 RepID=A0ABU9B858_9BURK
MHERPAAPAVSAQRPAPATQAVRPAHPGTQMLSARPGDHLSLMPGQLYFGSKAATVRTLLGSCVAITLWHPYRQLGGMCHFLLPMRAKAPPEALEGRFGAEAVALMVQRLRLAGTETHEYEAHLYGGADTQSGLGGPRAAIGERNIEMGWQLIDHYGFLLQAVDVGDDVPRTVSMDLHSGEVQVRRGAAIRKPVLPPEPAISTSRRKNP